MLRYFWFDVNDNGKFIDGGYVSGKMCFCEWPDAHWTLLFVVDRIENFSRAKQTCVEIAKLIPQIIFPYNTVKYILQIGSIVLDVAKLSSEMYINILHSSVSLFTCPYIWIIFAVTSPSNVMVYGDLDRPINYMFERFRLEWEKVDNHVFWRGEKYIQRCRAYSKTIKILIFSERISTRHSKIQFTKNQQIFFFQACQNRMKKCLKYFCEEFPKKLKSFQGKNTEKLIFMIQFVQISIKTLNLISFHVKRTILFWWRQIL